MGLWGKLVAETEIKGAADKFHDVFCNRPHHVSNICPDKIQSCALHEGDWGTHNSVIFWNYVLDGKASVAKQRVEAIDNEKNSITFNTEEGHLLDEFKSFRASIEATPKGHGRSLVKWTLEYEKLNEDVPEPLNVLKLAIHMTKDIDSHLIAQS